MKVYLSLVLNACIVALTLATVLATIAYVAHNAANLGATVDAATKHNNK